MKVDWSRNRQVVVKALIAFSVGFYVLHLMLSVFVDRALYADGSFFFINAISSQSFPIADDDKHIRLFVNFVNQLPLSVGVISGLKDVAVLRWLFGGGVFFVPLVLLLWSILLSFRANDFSVTFGALLSVVVFVMPSEIFILNQAITSLAICWVLVHYALLPLRPGRFEIILIVLLGVAVFRSHESMIIWGWALAFSALVGLRRSGRFKFDLNSLHRYYIAFVGALSSLFVVWWQLSHPVSQQTGAYLRLLNLLKPQELWQGNTRISMLVLAGIAVVWMSGFLVGKVAIFGRLLRLFAASLAVYGVFFAFSVFSSPEIANPVREYEYRFLITFGGGAVLFLVPYIRLKAGFEQSLLLSGVIFSGLLAATIWQFSNDLKWDAFKRSSIRTLAYADSIVVPPERVEERLISVGQGHLYRYRWGWTWPVFGLSLHESRNVLRIYKPEGFEQYFSLPKVEGDMVFVPFMQLPQKGFFDLSLLAQACVAVRCQ